MRWREADETGAAARAGASPARDPLPGTAPGSGLAARAREHGGPTRGGAGASRPGG